MLKYVFIVLTIFTHYAALASTKLRVGVPYKITRIAAIIQYHEFISAALLDAGYQMELVTIPTKNTFEMLSSGDVDAISYDDKGSDAPRTNIISTSFPIIFTHAKVFYRSDLLHFSDKTLGNFKIAISQNNLSIKKEAHHRHLKFISASNPYHCFQMLFDKQIDCCIAVDVVGTSTLKSFGNGDQKVSTLDTAFMEIPLYMSFNKKYKKDLTKIETAFKTRLKGDLSLYPLVMNNLNKNP